MSEYERTLSVAAPADAVFEYVSDTANVPKYLPDAEGAKFTTDSEGRSIKWAAEGRTGSVQVDAGDVTSELSEITLRMAFRDRKPSDVPTEEDEEALETIDQALRNIREHVEHAHRSRKANFM